MDTIEVIEVPLESIDYASSYIDLADDYLYASFIGETLANICNSITMERTQGDYPAVTIKFHCVPENLEEFKMISEKLLDDENDDSTYHYGSYDPYLSDRISFPTLLESYFANYLFSLYELDSDYVENELRKHPEHRYMFWKSPMSRSLDGDLFCSNKMWILPPSVKIEILTEYLGVRHLNFEKAERLKVNQSDVLFNSKNAVLFAEEEFMNATQCLAHSLMDYDSWDFQIQLPKVEDYYLDSEAGVILGVDSLGYKFLHFDPKKLSKDDLEVYNFGILTATETFDELMGYTAAISLDWSLLDDSKFEELCYDVIYYSGQFDVSTIRKMGSSRSRDGGRDIVAWTKELSEQSPAMYIFQCKHTTAKSLAGSKVDVADTIAQFGANGYGVMTSTVIDSTLFDKLDGVKRNLSIKTVTWSKYELERFLEKHPKIKARYF